LPSWGLGVEVGVHWIHFGQTRWENPGLPTTRHLLAHRPPIVERSATSPLIKV
jgi:hypothetical protein